MLFYVFNWEPDKLILYGVLSGFRFVWKSETRLITSLLNQDESK